MIEMNPRVSRSSALASKATGFPIAKIAARLAVGYLLEEIANDITRHPGVLRADDRLRRRQVAALRLREVPRRRVDALHAHEVGRRGDGDRAHVRAGVREGAALARARQAATVRRRPGGATARGLSIPAPERFEAILELFRRGVALEEVHERTSIDLWFLRELQALAQDPDAPFAGERTFKAVDTCAAEFPAQTPYYYSAWERPPVPRRLMAAPAHEVRRGERALGGDPRRRPQPHRQGIEFDYCCVHAAVTVRESGRDAVMINCNPELSPPTTTPPTASTSSRSPWRMCSAWSRREPEGVIVQFGGQTPLKLAAGLHAAGVPLLGTSVEAIDLAEDRGRFGELLGRLGYQAPPTPPRARSRRRWSGRGGRLRCWCAPAMCSAAGDGDRLLARGSGRVSAPRGG